MWHKEAQLELIATIGCTESFYKMDDANLEAYEKQYK